MRVIPLNRLIKVSRLETEELLLEFRRSRRRTALEEATPPKKTVYFLKPMGDAPNSHTETALWISQFRSWAMS